MPDGRWNCSVQHWSDYRQHFPCNLVTECVGGEDEAECPYTSDVQIIDKFPCEIASDSSFQKVEMPRPASDIWKKNHVTCPSQHVTHTFLACDVRSDCWEERYDTLWSCSAPVVPVPPAFTCDSGAERVPYTLVCDHRADCSDRSDEDFCQFPPCNVDDFHCDNGQSQKCDHHPQCYDQTDEKFCSFELYKLIPETSAPPGLVEINNIGLFKLPRLETLSLADNPLTSLLPTGPTPTVYSTLHALDLSGVKMPELNDSISKTFPNIRHLNLTNAQVERVTDDSLLLLTQLQTLDLRGCPLSSFSSRVFRPLSKLHAVYADTYRMCCPANLPENFDLNQCVSPPDRISSCDSLLGSTVLRASVSVYTIVAVTGNTLILLHHTYIRKVDMAVCFNMLLIHLCVADLMMGMYLTIISVADQAFLGHYLWLDVAWRNGAACRLAGFLAVLSRQASAFIVCLITLDRLLAIVFPVSSARFCRSAGWMVCTMSWVAGLCVASLSVLQAPSSDTMYSQSGLCIPLPTDTLDNWKEIVALKVVFVFNLLLVLLIVFGNVFIFWTLFSTNLLFSDTRPKSRELIIARRVNLLDAVDATCWCINLFGLLPFLSSNVGVNLIIFVLPLPSVLNPLLYSYSFISEYMQQKREEELRKWLQLESRQKDLGRKTCRKKCSNSSGIDYQ
ncbi:hypothetical protein C0Q70_05328 [Pomacea canaliculata]|uniref:G-protein coupled receptors family 1 profile domain-containing protein n=1 Tax=Pomacea canaliculata TaxID=400727 RepID=A0A2T7PKV3_POMCA|nr:hypothetical protein C0Q70_05328 [Pomacea canaliculata]